MDDRHLASRAAGGDVDSFGQLYDSHVGRVYDFAWRVARDAESAATITSDTFARAKRELPAFARSSSFKAWLLGLAHQTAVQRSEAAPVDVSAASPVHEEAFGSFEVPDPARVVDPALVGGDTDLPALVWEAATALNARDYALLDLHVRQSLDSGDIAQILGVSKGNAQTIVDRMEAAASDVIGGYVVAQKSDCDGMQSVLADYSFPPYTDELRRAVDAHIRECAACNAVRRQLPPPLEVLAGLAAIPAPPALKGDIWRELAGGWVAPPSAASLAGAAALAGAGSMPYVPPLRVPGEQPFGSPVAGGSGGGYREGGSSVTSESPWERNRLLWFAGAAVGLLIFAFLIGAVIAGAFGIGGGGDRSAGTTPATRTPATTRPATASGSLTPGVAIRTPTANLTPSPTPTPTETPTLPPPTEPPPTDTPLPVRTLPPTRTPIPARTPTPRPGATSTPRGGRSPTPRP